MIRLVVDNCPVQPDTLEFIEIVSDLTKRDQIVVRRFLECVHSIAEKDGPEAALAVLERAAPKRKPCIKVAKPAAI